MDKKMNLEAILAAMNTTYAIVKIMPKIVYTFISLSAVRVYNLHVFYSLLDIVCYLLICLPHFLR